ncbi:MAG TPA: pilus assembly protein TadG-related protein, partial [Acidimicrobiales bacterium]|nr:pilus assembly protein TadG-related protein [Acidimicrobiales bacterium]
MRQRGRRRGDERGAVIVLAGLMLTTMLAFSALVIDIANATQVKRQAQSTADAAALAAAQDLPNGPDAVATVKAYAYSNLSIPSTAWQGCSDTGALSVHPDSVNSNTCISIDSSYTRVRVKLPTQSVTTFFGAVIGTSHLNVNALATAEAQLRGDGRIIPAAVTSSMGTGNLCIENSGNDSDCAARSTGNFGSLDAPRLNIFKPSANEDPNSLRTNYAMSLDHDVQIYGGGIKVCDGDVKSPCSVSNSSGSYTANHLNVYTGNAVPPVTEGFVKGFTINTDDQGQVSFCGRLARPDITASNITDPHPDNCQPG